HFPEIIYRARRVNIRDFVLGQSEHCRDIRGLHEARMSGDSVYSLTKITDIELLSVRDLRHIAGENGQDQDNFVQCADMVKMVLEHRRHLCLKGREEDGRSRKTQAIAIGDKLDKAIYTHLHSVYLFSQRIPTVAPCYHDQHHEKGGSNRDPAAGQEFK